MSPLSADIEQIFPLSCNFTKIYNKFYFMRQIYYSSTRSFLLMQQINGNFNASAIPKASSVYGYTPRVASINTTNACTMEAPARTLFIKAECPGVSMIVIL